MDSGQSLAAMPGCATDTAARAPIAIANPRLRMKASDELIGARPTPKYRPARCARSNAKASRHLQQHLGQPLRLVDHHVVAARLVDEGLPRLVGLALRQRLVERGLRILRRADVGLLGDGLA